MFVKPAKPGLIVRDPISMVVLPDDGAEKPDSSYWIRRQMDGDVVEATPPAAAAAPAVAKTR